MKYSSDHLLLNALDSRAATHEKLGQLTPALRDAKQMIEAMPKLSKVSQAIFRGIFALLSYIRDIYDVEKYYS